MYVYKLCWKMIVKSLKPIIIYGLIFLGFAFLVNKNFYKQSGKEADKIPVLLINEGRDTKLTDAFYEYMNDNVTYVKMPEGQYELKKDMFYDGIKCVIRLPESFTQDYVNNQTLRIASYHLVETDDTVRVELLINRFLKEYMECQKRGEPLETAVLECNKKLRSRTAITYVDTSGTKHQKYSMYSNYLSYVLLASIMSYCVLLLFHWKQDKLQKRNEIAPVQMKRLYCQTVFTACIFAIFLAVIYIIIGAYLANVKLVNAAVTLININIFVYTLFSVAISVLLGVTISSVKGIENWEQVIAIGSCFISGVFVQQDMLPVKILTISNYLPTYWFVKVNNKLGNMKEIRFHDYQSFFIEEAIILCYAIILFVISFIVIEKKVNITD